MNNFSFHGAFQVCDTASRTAAQRFCGNDRSKLTRKSVTSFFESLCVAMRMYDKFRLKPVVTIFNDHSTKDTRHYLDFVQEHYSKKQIEIHIVDTVQRGLMNTVRACYDFLESQGQDIVYQIQDDFLFQEDAIYQMVDIFTKVQQDTGSQPYVISHHHPYYFGEWYRYTPTPRILVPGCSQYWIQSYELGCTFLTGKTEFSRHWDMYNKFLTSSENDPMLEVDSLNKILVRPTTMGLIPAVTVASHMQKESDRDPYFDWKPIWNKVPDLRNLQSQ